MKKPCLILEAVLLLAAVFTGCTAKRTMENHQGIDVASPDWVAKLSAAADAKRHLPFCSARRFPSSKMRCIKGIERRQQNAYHLYNRGQL